MRMTGAEGLRVRTKVVVGKPTANGSKVIENMSNYFLQFMWLSTRAKNVSNTCFTRTIQKKKKFTQVHVRPLVVFQFFTFWFSYIYKYTTYNIYAHTHGCCYIVYLVTILFLRFIFSRSWFPNEFFRFFDRFIFLFFNNHLNCLYFYQPYINILCFLKVICTIICFSSEINMML